MTAPASGTDISAQLGMTAASSGAYTVAGMTAETALTAATVLDGLFSSQWYGLNCPSASDQDHQNLAAFCEAASPPHYYGVTTSEAGSIVANSTTDIGYILSNLGYRRTAVQYSTTNKNAIMSYLARILTTAWRGQRTTITLMYKREPGVAPEFLSTTQADTLQAKHVNVYAGYANTATIIEYGVSCSGDYTDTIIGADALASDVQNVIFNTLYTTNTKVPQTDSGMQLLLNAASGMCSVYVNNGWLATGVWTAPGFGTLNTGDLLTLGFYVFAPSMLVQTAAERAAREAPLLQIAAKTAGAIHSSDVLIFVNM